MVPGVSAQSMPNEMNPNPTAKMELPISKKHLSEYETVSMAQSYV
jgi:hypothetical protein